MGGGVPRSEGCETFRVWPPVLRLAEERVGSLDLNPLHPCDTPPKT